MEFFREKRSIHYLKNKVIIHIATFKQYLNLHTINLLIKNNLAKVYLSFVVTLVFFFIVNGILTGSFIEEPVVLYNNAENSGIRMGTIPIEDIFYGFLLITSIIVLFEYLNTKLPMQK